MENVEANFAPDGTVSQYLYLVHVPMFDCSDGTIIYTSTVAASENAAIMYQQRRLRRETDAVRLIWSTAISFVRIYENLSTSLVVSNDGRVLHTVSPNPSFLSHVTYFHLW
jgi:hypothetical protein